MLMPTRVIKCVDVIGAHKAQSQDFRFLNHNKDPFDWTDEVPADDPAFQGLLEEEEGAAVYPDITAELPGVTLEDDLINHQAVVDDEKPNFRELATQALDNAGIDPASCCMTTSCMQGGGPTHCPSRGTGSHYCQQG
jgi:hypothetical protein